MEHLDLTYCDNMNVKHVATSQSSKYYVTSSAKNLPYGGTTSVIIDQLLSHVNYSIYG